MLLERISVVPNSLGVSCAVTGPASKAASTSATPHVPTARRLALVPRRD
jgi:hypothetical protein